MNHVNSNACFQEELEKSYQVEGQEDEGELLSVVSAEKIQVNLSEHHASGDDLSSDDATLVEGILAPAFHSESLNDAEVNLVVVLREAEGAVRVSEKSDDHTDQEEVMALPKADESANGQHKWRNVNLDGIEVSNVGNIEVAEHANHSVGEDDERQALVVTLLIIEQLRQQAGK